MLQTGAPPRPLPPAALPTRQHPPLTSAGLWQFWLDQYLYCDSHYSQISHVLSLDYFSFCMNFDFPKG